MYSRDDTFRETIDKFIDKQPKQGMIYKNRKISKDTVSKVFENLDNQNLDKKISKLSVDEIREDIIKSIQNKTSKERPYYVYSKYIEYLNDNYYKEKKIKKLPIYYSELERRLLIAKKMHTEFNIEEIAREFLVSERTIEKDLSALNNGKVRVLNQELKIEYEKRNGGNIKLKSKAHPLFLVENLTQVIAILNGLLYVRKDYGYAEYAKEVAVAIWMQLSDDAKDRIQNVLVDELNLNKRWYDEIAQSSERKFMFKIEEDFLDHKYLDIRKNGKNCIIQYENDEGKIIEQYVSEIISKEGDIITAIIYEEENREIKIDTNKIKCYLPKLKKHNRNR